MVQQQYTEIDRGNDWAAITGQRAQIYWFLSEFFLKQPDTAFLCHLKDQLEAFPVLEHTSLHSLLATLSMTEPTDDQAQALAIEYTRLFHGLREDYGPPPPYESLYRQGLPGEITVAVFQYYLAAGYDLTTECTGPQDHLGVELKFMALLCHDEAEACDRQDWQAVKKLRRFQNSFLKQHITVWCYDYCNRLSEATNEKFYRAVGSMTADFIEKDRQILQELELQSERSR